MKGSEMNAVALEVPLGAISIPRPRAEVAVLVERDGRTMNNMDPETKRIHVLLDQWGRATRADIDNGWPPATLLGRMIDQGPMGASQTGRPPTTMSEQDQRTDSAVAKLCEIDRKAVTFYYQKWVTLDMLAKAMGMRVRQTQNVLRRARWRVGAHLDAMP
jgi:hypothetical protein